MATYKNLQEVWKTRRGEEKLFGNEYIGYTCPERGFVDSTVINHVHYSNNAIKK